MYLQMLLYWLIVKRRSSGKSLGCGEVKRNRIFGKRIADASSRFAKRAPGCDRSLNVSENPEEFLCSEGVSVDRS